MLALADERRACSLGTRNAVHVYRFEPFDRAIEGMPVQPRTVCGRLISLRHRPSAAAMPQPRRRSPRPPARPPPATARPWQAGSSACGSWSRVATLG